MSAVGFKLAAAAGLFAIAIVGGTLPLMCRRGKPELLSGLNAAAAGVFFSSAMVHMIPESSEALAVAWGDAVPWGGLITSVGFLLILCVEEAVMMSQNGAQHVHTALPTSDSPPTPPGGALALPPSPQPRQWNAVEAQQLSTQRGADGDSDLDGYDYAVGSSAGGHWHAPRRPNPKKTTLTEVVLMAALSVHSIMEGLGLGANGKQLYNVLLAIAMHKGLAAYALGTALLHGGGDLGTSSLVTSMLVFGAMTPFGILLGMAIGGEGVASAVCVALAAGTFLYVSLMEVLPKELASPGKGWGTLGSLLVGFWLSTGVGLLVE